MKFYVAHRSYKTWKKQITQSQLLLSRLCDSIIISQLLLLVLVFNRVVSISVCGVEIISQGWN